MDGVSIFPVREFLKNKWVWLVLVIDVVMISVTIGMFVLDASKSSVINLEIAPVDATISINGETGFTNGMYAVMPGTYEVVISREDMKSKAFTIELAPDYIATLATFLSGVDGDLSFYELPASRSSWLKLVEIASKNNNITTDNDTSAEAFIAEREERMAILEVLPIVVDKYVVASREAVHYEVKGFVNEEGDVALKIIDYTGGNYENALQLVRDAGFNPDDYDIEYDDRFDIPEKYKFIKN